MFYYLRVWLVPLGLPDAPGLPPAELPPGWFVALLKLKLSMRFVRSGRFTNHSSKPRLLNLQPNVSENVRLSTGERSGE